VPPALAEVLALALAEVLGAVAAEEEEDEEELQPAAASPMQATPSSAASRVGVVRRVSTATTVAIAGCAVQPR
jgi:hypothetical protein